MAENKSSSRIFLLSSLVLGVLAMVAAFVYLENTAGEERGPKASVLVAKRDLREGAAIDPAKDFDVLEIPAKFADLKARALAPEFRESYKGQRVNRNVYAGTPVMLADLAATATLDLRGDMRAVSVSVKGANALSGLVVPGDYVKLMVTRPVTPPRSAAVAPASGPADVPPPPMEMPTGPRYETVLVAPTPFRVLAVNSRLSRSRANLTAAEAYKSAGESREQTVTLEVSEAQAKSILEQTGAGQMPITLILCPPGSPGVPAAPGAVAAPTTTVSRTGS